MGETFCLGCVIHIRNNPYVRKSIMAEEPKEVEKENALVPNSEEEAVKMKKNLKLGIDGFIKIFFRIEYYYWLYAFYAFYTTCETIVLCAWDLIASSLNILLPIFGVDKIKRTSFFACIIIAGYTLIVQDFQYFDVSFLYHFFRGQSTVKLYSVGLSTIIFEMMLTTTGKTYFEKLPKIIINSNTKPGQIWFEVLLSFLYSIIHFFIIYIDFILFVIILNSTASNRFLYLFGINISKLKAAVFKKFDKKLYKNGIMFDAKDRFNKLIYCAIFLLTMQDRVDTQLYLTIIKALAFSSVIDYLRSLALLSTNGQLSQIREIRLDLIEECYLKPEKVSRHESIMRCLNLDFTVIPYILFLFKFMHIIFKQIKKMDFNLIVTYAYIILVVFTLLANLFLWLVRKHYKHPSRSKVLKKDSHFAWQTL